jgi:hypothetical protein
MVFFYCFGNWWSDSVEKAEQSFVSAVILSILREIFVNIFAVFDSHKNNFIVFFLKTEAIISQSYPVKVLKSLDWSYIKFFNIF